MEYLLEVYMRMSSDFEAVMRGDKKMSEKEIEMLINGLAEVMRGVVVLRAIKNEGTLGR
ncbi:hypothetical protein AB9M41_004653 [Vibrio alginolyticus]